MAAQPHVGDATKYTLAQLESVMVLALDLADTLREIRGRRLLPSEARAFWWVVEAIEAESVQAEFRQLPESIHVYYLRLVGDFMEVLFPGEGLGDPGSIEAVVAAIRRKPLGALDRRSEQVLKRLCKAVEILERMEQDGKKPAPEARKEYERLGRYFRKDEKKSRASARRQAAYAE